MLPAFSQITPGYFRCNFAAFTLPRVTPVVPSVGTEPRKPAANLSAAPVSASLNQWLYTLSVTAGDACPSRCCTSVIGAPARINPDANECRKVFTFTCLNFARRSAG